MIKKLKSKWEKKNSYHQIGNAYLQYEVTIEKDVAIAANRNLVTGEANRLVKNVFACCFKKARWKTTGGSHIEHINMYVKTVWLWEL